MDRKKKVTKREGRKKKKSGRSRKQTQQQRKERGSPQDPRSKNKSKHYEYYDDGGDREALFDPDYDTERVYPVYDVNPVTKLAQDPAKILELQGYGSCDNGLPTVFGEMMKAQTAMVDNEAVRSATLMLSVSLEEPTLDDLSRPLKDVIYDNMGSFQSPEMESNTEYIREVVHTHQRKLVDEVAQQITGTLEDLGLHSRTYNRGIVRMSDPSKVSLEAESCIKAYDESIKKNTQDAQWALRWKKQTLAESALSGIGAEQQKKKTPPTVQLRNDCQYSVRPYILDLENQRRGLEKYEQYQDQILRKNCDPEKGVRSRIEANYNAASHGPMSVVSGFKFGADGVSESTGGTGVWKKRDEEGLTSRALLDEECTAKAFIARSFLSSQMRKDLHRVIWDTMDRQSEQQVWIVDLEFVEDERLLSPWAPKTLCLDVAVRDVLYDHEMPVVGNDSLMRQAVTQEQQERFLKAMYNGEVHNVALPFKKTYCFRGDAGRTGDGSSAKSGKTTVEQSEDSVSTNTNSTPSGSLLPASDITETVNAQSYMMLPQYNRLTNAVYPPMRSFLHIPNMTPILFTALLKARISAMKAGTATSKAILAADGDRSSQTFIRTAVVPDPQMVPVAYVDIGPARDQKHGKILSLRISKRLLLGARRELHELTTSIVQFILMHHHRHNKNNNNNNNNNNILSRK